jgi:arginyl-tRNA synthetase
MFSLAKYRHFGIGMKSARLDLVVTTYDEILTRLQAAFDHLDVGADPVLRPSDRSDFQANGAMALGKKLGRAPRDVAQEILGFVDLSGVAEAEIAGPGFINLTLATPFLSKRLQHLVADERLGISETAKVLTVVIDYSAPNVAKEMHVGHLRSTVIGDSIRRIYEFLGHNVIARNHVGDWGTPFGMLIEHLVDMGEDAAVESLSIGDLDGFYRSARTKFDADDTFKDRSRARVVSLQSGDPETRRLWQLLVDQSVAYFSEVYQLLDIKLTSDEAVGESFYNDMLEDVLTDLDAAGLLVESNGAQCVFPDGFTNRDGEPLPLIVQKSDEGFGYAASDLAAVRDRVGRLKADEILYVVGTPQAQHFEMVYAVAGEVGWLPASVRCEHVSFGNVLGTDRKMFKTRSGETVKLVGLVEDAIARAYAALATRASDLSDDERRELATQIARAAIKYADLSTERQRDYVFDLERMLAFEGDTGPYLEYAHARIRSIFRRLATSYSPEGVSFALSSDAERQLALGLLAFPEAFEQAFTQLAPNKLCAYLFDLAQRFTTFYENCPVLNVSGDLQAERLALCDLSARTLALGLSLLGIGAPERM